MAVAIEVRDLSKSFKIYREKHQSVKERVVHAGRSRARGEFWALRDIDIEVVQGETLGLLGHNGSGKSTLLKCMAGILRPTTGTVRTNGRIAALLELGAGFHPDLTGRENVYQNASLLGLSKVDVDRRFDDIVGFAGIEEHIDTQVKFYSSGMYVRLGFAVAINVDPEILLVDEVLAVGDEAFQQKCIAQVHQFQTEGRTIVFVTHGAELVRQMCSRAIALDRGRMIAEGDPGAVIHTFRERLMAGVTSAAEVDPQAARSSLSPVWHRVRVADVRVVTDDPTAEALHAGEPLTIVVDLESDGPVSDVIAALSILTPRRETVFGTNTVNAGADVGTVDGKARVRFHVPELPLMEGTYTLAIGAHTLGGLLYDQRDEAHRIEVVNTGRDVGTVRVPMEVVVEHGPPGSSAVA